MISLIAATATNMGIGLDGKIPWQDQLPRDMAHFKRITLGKTVVMGRKTWESLGGKPLVERDNIVLTRDSGYLAQGARTVQSIDEFLDRGDEVMVIGGGQVYELFMPHADRLYLTLVDDNFVADTYFPALNTLNILSDWYDTEPAQYRPTDERNWVGCVYRTLQRIDRR